MYAINPEKKTHQSSQGAGSLPVTALDELGNKYVRRKLIIKEHRGVQQSETSD